MSTTDITITEGRRGSSMAVCAHDDDEVLGKVALRLPGNASPATTCDAIRPADHPVGELSYWVLPHARGRGLATAAAGAMLDMAREIGGVRSVVLDIETENLPSRASHSLLAPGTFDCESLLRSAPIER